MLASGGEEMVREAGDVAHVVGLGLEDPREFLAIDVWTSDDNIEAVYGRSLEALEEAWHALLDAR